MADTRAAQLRRLWLNVHLWIALGLVALLVPFPFPAACWSGTTKSIP